jgi:hypothetical protein
MLKGIKYIGLDSMKWIYPKQDRNKRRTHANAIMNVRVS